MFYTLIPLINTSHLFQHPIAQLRDLRSSYELSSKKIGLQPRTNSPNLMLIEKTFWSIKNRRAKITDKQSQSTILHILGVWCLFSGQFKALSMNPQLKDLWSFNPQFIEKTYHLCILEMTMKIVGWWESCPSVERHLCLFLFPLLPNILFGCG